MCPRRAKVYFKQAYAVGAAKLEYKKLPTIKELFIHYWYVKT